MNIARHLIYAVLSPVVSEYSISEFDKLLRSRLECSPLLSALTQSSQRAWRALELGLLDRGGKRYWESKADQILQRHIQESLTHYWQTHPQGEALRQRSLADLRRAQKEGLIPGEGLEGERPQERLARLNRLAQRNQAMQEEAIAMAALLRQRHCLALAGCIALPCGEERQPLMAWTMLQYFQHRVSHDKELVQIYQFYKAAGVSSLLEGIDQKLGVVDQKLDRLDQTLGGVDLGLADLNDHVKHQQSQLEAIHGLLHQLSSQIKGIPTLEVESKAVSSPPSAPVPVAASASAPGLIAELFTAPLGDAAAAPRDAAVVSAPSADLTLSKPLLSPIFKRRAH